MTGGAGGENAEHRTSNVKRRMRRGGWGRVRILYPEGVVDDSPGIDDQREAFPGAGHGRETQPRRGCGVTNPRAKTSASGTRVGVRPGAAVRPQGIGLAASSLGCHPYPRWGWGRVRILYPEGVVDDSPGIDDQREAFPGAGHDRESQPRRGCGVTNPRAKTSASGTRVGFRRGRSSRGSSRARLNV